LLAEQREVGGEVIHCGLRCAVCGDGSEIIFSGVTLVLHGPGDKQALCVSYVCRACDTKDILWLQPDEGFDA
jgi:hypothetical protein